MGKHVPGPKELQRIALRERRYHERGPGAKPSKISKRAELAKFVKTLPKAPIVEPIAPPQFFTIDRETVSAIMDGPSKPTTAPVQASAPTQEKKTMKNRSVKRVKKVKSKAIKRSASQAAANLKAAKAKTKTAAPADGGENQTQKVVKMLLDPKGCTAAEVCEATGWAAVSIPPIAARNKIELRKEPEGRGVRYFGTAAAA